MHSTGSTKSLNYLRAHRLVYKSIALIPFNRDRVCCLCGRASFRFVPYRGGSNAQPALQQALGMIGSDVDQFECPHCGSHDRERHLFLYMQASGFVDRIPASRILHFAPESQLSRWIERSRPVTYVKADISPASSDMVRLDLTDLDVDDASFDLIIANHVLEHVGDDAAAIREIHRSLSSGGYAILQTPFASSLSTTFEDKLIQSEAARLQAYGQEDHVRMYGQDIASLFEASGLISCIKSHSEVLPGFSPRIYGVNGLEPFFLFKKP